MPCTLDSVLAFFRGTILHPLGSPACLGLLVASGLEKAPFTIRTDTLGIQISESLSSRSKFALFCVGFSWLLQVNRIMNRRALNPRPAGEYNWPREVVVITGGQCNASKVFSFPQSSRKLTEAVIQDLVALEPSWRRNWSGSGQ